MNSILEERDLSAGDCRSLRFRAEKARAAAREILFSVQETPEQLRRYRLLMRDHAMEMRLSPSYERFEKFRSLAKLYRNFSLPDCGASIAKLSR